MNTLKREVVVAPVRLSVAVKAWIVMASLALVLAGMNVAAQFRAASAQFRAASAQSLACGVSAPLECAILIVETAMEPFRPEAHADWIVHVSDADPEKRFTQLGVKRVHLTNLDGTSRSFSFDRPTAVTVTDCGEDGPMLECVVWPTPHGSSHREVIWDMDSVSFTVDSTSL